jgi:hypothetical protein
MITVVMMVRTRKMSSVLYGNYIASQEKSAEQNGAVCTQASISTFYRENFSKNSPRF